VVRKGPNVKNFRIMGDEVYSRVPEQMGTIAEFVIINRLPGC
jgi:NADPH:quinone reductase-like Zn-dependent oxidoreductase